MAAQSNRPLEIYSELYIGDCFVDTLQFTADEHAAFRLLLLHTWLKGEASIKNLAAIASVSPRAWRTMAPTILPLLKIATDNIAQWKEAIGVYDGVRLPAAEWHIVRTIILERDGYACQYCGDTNRLHVDHRTAIARGGSNAFENLMTSCAPCNQSKGPKLLGDWTPPALRSN